MSDHESSASRSPSPSASRSRSPSLEPQMEQQPQQQQEPSSGRRGTMVFRISFFTPPLHPTPLVAENDTSQALTQQQPTDLAAPAQEALGGLLHKDGGAVAGGGGDNEKDTLKLRLDLNLDVDVQIKARIHGDVTLSLLDS
ncbi:hypothetical protein R3P38DRAFT_3257449 [Favolaschia claudopus]|uniref:Uncharacterized protein n=1 Tax=Favolaschia claudopus TaxID=2862362 RepID=A0AAW0DCG4_9AGAR